MKPTAPKFEKGTLVWVKADKIDLSQDEVGEIVSSSFSVYEDPRTGETSHDGLIVKLKISNTRAIFPAKRLRLFCDKENGVQAITAGGDTTRSPYFQQQQRRRSKRSSCRGVTPSPRRLNDDKPVRKVDALDKQKKPNTISRDTGKVTQKQTGKTGTAKTKNDPVIITEKSKITSSDSILEISESDEEEPLISLKKPLARKRNSATKKSSAKRNRKEQPVLLVASESDSDDEKDRPFRVEYATTGRSTCKSCDEKIEKNCLRVASRPLFRGKPGFVVYRHLKCQIFPEEITKINEVGGWRRLKSEDQALLSDQLEESKLRIEEENQELDADELVQQLYQGKLREIPPGSTATLLPFQVEGVSWMYDQEKSQVAGGILADEMGMGKTLQTITTILDNRPKLQHAKSGMKHPPSTPDLQDRKTEEILWNDALKSCHENLKMAGVPDSIVLSKKKVDPVGARGGTLVVCPLIALYQWKEEIQKFTQPNALTICIYHGNDRHEKFPQEILAKYDIVLTTYQVLEADFRKMVSPNKVKCPNCGRAFKIDKLAVHLKYFCGETAQRTAAQSRQRRSSDHPQQNRNKRKAVPRIKNLEKSHSKVKSNTSTLKRQKVSKKMKKIVRVNQVDEYESDSELSLPEDFDITSKRPSRSAAKAAKQRLSASSKEWIDVDSEEVSDNEYHSSDSESSLESSAPVCRFIATKQAKKVEKVNSSDTDDSSLVSDIETNAFKRSKKRQAMALSMVKRDAKKASVSKEMEKKSSLKGIKRKKGKMGKNPSPKNPGDNNGNDPLNGIDLEELKEKAMLGCRKSVLHTISWWRIVLDEAHNIKSRSSSTSSSAFHLTGIHRWALSGTPLQNRVGELYSLIRFLRIDPMAHYFCRRKGCDCKSIFYRMDHGKCKNCGCASSQHFSYFNKHVLNVIQREGYSGDGRRAMMKLKNEVLDKCLLRRTKESRAEDMNLPPRIVTIKPIRLHPREEDFYNALYTQTKSSFDDYVAEGTLLNNYAHIFDLLTKMRQAVDHPYLIVHSKKNHDKRAQEGLAVTNGSTECELCGEPPTDRVLSSCCNSAFCRSCIIDMMTLADAEQSSTRCPCCRNPLSIDLNQTNQQVVDNGTLTVNDTAGMPSLKEMRNVSSGSILRRINLSEFSTSTKLESLVEELCMMRKDRPGSKALVFSQFTSMLDLCRWRLVSDPYLQDSGLGVRIVHGGMNVQSRDEALKAFKEDTSVRVLLMSLKAGGVALNLTVANEAYLLDPWWNPAAEMQAIDRTHRLGQHRPIRAVRFIAEGTVEERVLQLQEKKRLVFDGTVGRDAASLKMLTVDDMKAMFT